jgi:TLC domain
MKPQHYKDLAVLGICTASLVACILHHTQQNATPIFRVLPFCMSAYFAVDMIATRSLEYRIHHTASLGIIFYLYYYRVNTHQVESLIYHFIKTEMSTFFLVFRPYLPKGTYLYHANNMAFYTTFAKCRILDIYQHVIRPSSPIYAFIRVYTPNDRVGTTILLGSCYTLYLLNVYWFCVMTRYLFRGNRPSSKQ